MEKLLAIETGVYGYELEGSVSSIFDDYYGE